MRIYFAVSISMSTVIRIFFACLYWNASKAIHGKLFVYVIMTDYISIYALWKIYIYAKTPLVYVLLFTLCILLYNSIQAVNTSY